MIKTTKTILPDVLILEPKVYRDSRGFFLETYQHKHYAELGIDLPFVQDNFSRSSKNVLRGLHYQLKHPQGKLVSVTRGKIFDVVADIRPNSPTFGLWVGEILSDENHKRIYVPPGYAHGFVVLSDIVDFHYKCTDYYHPEDGQGILYNDPMLNIDWPVTDVILSEKDKINPTLKQQAKTLLPTYTTPADAAETV